jgi:hypothetical protein
MTSVTKTNNLNNGLNQHLTVEYLIRFSFPLALTFLMMSGSAPIVSGGITIMQDADGERIHLFAFLLTFAISLFLYSPMFMARNVAIRTVNDRRSLFRYTYFFIACASISSVILLLISQVDAVGNLVFVNLLKTEQQIALLARQGMFIFVPIPILIALRGLAHGCHINNGHTWYVGAGTGIRLVCMAAFVFGYGIHQDFSGPIIGGLTFLLGISIETVFCLAMLWNKPQWTTIGEERLLDYSEYLRYAGPLMLASVLTQFLTPILIYYINQCFQADENGATFNLMRDTGWVMFSTLLSIQPVVIFKVLIRFTAFLSAAITAVILLISLTPLRQLIFVGILEVDNTVILRLTFVSLLWLIPHPIINAANQFVASMHTRSGRTIWVTIGNLAGFAVLGILAWFLDLDSFDGVVVAVNASAIFNLTVALVQMLGLMRGGFRATVSPATMVEKFDRINHAKSAEIIDDQNIPDQI